MDPIKHLQATYADLEARREAQETTRALLAEAMAENAATLERTNAAMDEVQTALSSRNAAP